MSKNKTISKFKLPSVKSSEVEIKRTLPYNGNAVTEKGFSFSFSCFDRSHKLFNLGDNTSDGTVSGSWFLDFLDCMKSVSNLTVAELQQSRTHDLHPIDWSKTNTSAPANSEQCEFWQFRINKSKGRVIGFVIDSFFYVVYLDPHHNLTNSEGYGKEAFYDAPLSEYEILQQALRTTQEELEHLRLENKEYEDLINAT